MSKQAKKLRILRPNIHFRPMQSSGYTISYAIFSYAIFRPMQYL